MKPQASQHSPLNDFAVEFVRLGLATHRLKPNLGYLDTDSHRVPGNIVAESEAIGAIEEVISRAKELAARLKECRATSIEVAERHRLATLKTSAHALAHLVGGPTREEQRFETEVVELFGIRPPNIPLSHFENITDELSATLPAWGRQLEKRYHQLLEDFTLREEQIEPELRMALEEAQRRTHRYVTLPPNEHCRIRGEPGANYQAYLTFECESQSLMKFSLDRPTYAFEILDTVCHEAYPGHHVFATLREQVFLSQSHRVENAFYVLKSPLATIAEGTAEVGVDLAFPGEERAEYERRCFNRLGFPVDREGECQAVRQFWHRAASAKLSIARCLFDREIAIQEATGWLMTKCLMPKVLAEKFVNFCLEWGPYVATYTVGRDIVARWLEAVASRDPQARWNSFAELLVEPRPPAELGI